MDSLIRNKLYFQLSDLSEKMLRQVPPFDKLPLLREVTPYFFGKYLQYRSKLSSSAQDEIFEAQIIKTKHMMKRCILGHKTVFEYNHDECSSAGKILDNFFKWIKMTENIPQARSEPSPEYEKGIKVSTVIKQFITRELADYQYDKQLSDASITVFIKDCGTYKLFLSFDRGTMRHFISVHIGVYPFFQMDIMDLMGNGQSRFWYHSQESLIKSVHTAIDYLKFVCPHFEKAVERAFAM